MDLPRATDPSAAHSSGSPGDVIVDEWQVTLCGPPELTAAQTAQLRHQVGRALQLLAEQLTLRDQGVRLDVSHSDGG